MSEFTPSDVYAHVELVLGELELLRQEMGRPKDSRPELGLSQAQARNSFFEALTLFRKADRLCFERTGEQAALAHPPPGGEIQPTHVRAVVDIALTRLRQVKHKLGVTEGATVPGRVDGKKPADVVKLLTKANRQLNLMLEQPFSPNDVYQLMTMAVGYTAVLLGRADTKAKLELPAFERKKRPGDVYKRVWTCLGKLDRVMETIGQPMMDVAETQIPVEQISPSDVYDLASLLLAEVVYLHSRVPSLGPPAASEFYEVGHKLPAHVFQMVGYLEAHLDALAAAVAKDPKVLG
jgi:hypothetical protein